MSQGKRATPSSITPAQNLEQIHITMRALVPVIKNATEAKTHLLTKGWIFAGEEISMETLARTLFALVAEQSAKLPPTTANPILAVAYLLTECNELQTKTNLTTAITKHLLDSLLHITTDIHTRLENHLQVVNESNKTHLELTKKLLTTQEKLEETTEKVNTNAKTYSQAAATAPTPHPPQPTTTHAQLQIRNRAEIRQRQVLINFIRTEGMELDNLNEDTLARKALDALNTTWAAKSDPKPPLPKLKASILLRTGSLLLELDSPTAANWLKGDQTRDTFLANIGNGANIQNRSYQVITQFVPVQFHPEDPDYLRQFESFDNLDPHTILKAEWIKPIRDPRPNQKVATMRVYYKDTASANKTLSKGASILNKHITPKKPKKEPIRCLHCQRFGHSAETADMKLLPAVDVRTRM